MKWDLTNIVLALIAAALIVVICSLEGLSQVVERAGV